MKKTILILILCFALPIVYATFLGEYKIGETVYFSAQFNNGSGVAKSATSADYVILNTSFINKTKSNGTGMTSVNGYAGMYQASYIIPSNADKGIWTIRINGTIDGISPATVISFKVVDNTTQDVYTKSLEIMTETDSVEENQATLEDNLTIIRTEQTNGFDRMLINFSSVITNQSNIKSAVDIAVIGIRTNESLLQTHMQNNFTKVDSNLTSVRGDISTLSTNMGNNLTKVDSNLTTIRTEQTNGFERMLINFSKVITNQSNIKLAVDTLSINVSQVPNKIWNENRTTYNITGTFGNLMRLIKTALHIIE